MRRNYGFEGPHPYAISTVAIDTGGFVSVLYDPITTSAASISVKFFDENRQIISSAPTVTETGSLTSAASFDGGFIMSWLSSSGQIMAHAYNSDGTERSQAFQIAPSGYSSAFAATITDLGGGSFAELHVDTSDYSLSASIRTIQSDGSVTTTGSFSVGSGTTNPYAYPEITAFKDQFGETAFAVSWYEAGSAYVQVFNSSGTTGPTLLTEIHNDDYGRHHMVALQTGGFAVAYSERDASGLTHILLQTFKPDGTFLSTVTLVPAPVVVENGDAFDVVTGGNGNIYVIWSGAGEDYSQSVFVQEFRPDGTLVGATTNLSPHDGYNTTPSTALLNDGSVVVVWGSNKMAGIEWQTVGAPTNSPSIVTAVGQSTVDVNPYDVQTVALGNGGFASVLYLPNFAGGSTPPDVKFQLVSATGEAIGAPILIEQDAANIKTASLSNGGFVVTWGYAFTQGAGLKSQVFNADGTAVTGKFAISSDSGPAPVADVGNGNFVEIHTGVSGVVGTIRSQTTGAVVDSFSLSGPATTNSLQIASISGGFAAIWSDAGHAYYQTFSPSGAPTLTAPVGLTETYADAAVNHIVSLPNGGFALAYQESGPDGLHIYVQSFNAAGLAAAPKYEVVGAGHDLSNFGNNYSISAYPNGQFMVTWSEVTVYGSASEVFAQLFNQVGTPTGAAFQISNGGGGNNVLPSAATLSDGHIAVAWNAGTNSKLAWTIIGLDTPATEKPGGVLKHVQVGEIETVAIGGGGFAAVLYDTSTPGVAAAKFELFDAAGDHIAVTNNTISNDALYVAASGLSNGDFVVTYQRYSTSALEGKIIHADGSAGGDFQIASAGYGDGGQAPVADLGGGRFVEVHTDPSSTTLVANIRDVANLSGTPFSIQIDSATSHPYSRPDVIKLTSTPGQDIEFAVSWFDIDNHFVVQTFKDDGTATSSKLVLDNSYPGEAHLAARPDGGFMALYTALGSTNAIELDAQRFDASGAKVGAAVHVDSNHAVNPYGDSWDISSRPNGDMVAFWSAEHSPTSLNAFSRTFNAATEQWSTTDNMVGDPGDQYDWFPDSATLSDGRIAVVYSSYFVSGLEWSII